jgi:hypothetical protein
MLHVIKKNPTTKEKQTRNLLLCEMIVWFFTKIRSYLLIVIFATLQHPFFRFTPWCPLTHNGVQSFLKSHLKLLYSYDFTNYFSKLSKEPLILLRLTIVAYCQCKGSHTSRWKFFGRTLMKMFKASNFKCDFKIGLTPVLTLSQLLFTFHQLSSRFLQNLFYLFFRHSLLVWEPGPLDYMGTVGHCPQYTWFTITLFQSERADYPHFRNTLSQG